jgi:hypothetical protein
MQRGEFPMLDDSMEIPSHTMDDDEPENKYLDGDEDEE